jgi:hypothetical protein
MAKKKVDTQTVKEIEQRFADRMKASRRLGQVPEGAPRPPRPSIAHLLAGYGQDRPAQVGWQKEKGDVRVVNLDMMGQFHEDDDT